MRVGVIKVKLTTHKVGDITSMYVDRKIDEKTVPMMVDTETTHKFIHPRKVKGSDLKKKKSKGSLKTVNIETKSSNEVARG